MQLTQKHLEYWRKNLAITAVLLFIWFVGTFVLGYYARELLSGSLAGHSRSGWAAQGSLSST